MASLKEQSVVNGGLILVKVKGVTVGRCQSIRGTRSYSTQGIYELGSIMPQEHVQNQYRGSITVSRMMLRTSDFAVRKIAGLGEDILSIGILDFEVIDKSTGKTLRCYHGCTATGYNEGFQTNTVSTEDVTFEYLYCTDGKENGNFINYADYPYSGNVT